ncbi:MAG TPA: alpha/beta fold hydrolase [Alphaproteobacteria bacterium]|nr:alpha/beta fold hydrolase [Alphaproteobacteria bacterium]
MVEVYFATNRNPVPAKEGYFGERFHADGPMFFRVGAARLDKVSDHPDEGYVVREVRVFPEKLGADGNEVAKLLGSTKLFAELRSQMTKQERDVVVLIHGFASTFVDSLRRAAQICEAYRVQPPGDGVAYEPYVVVFSWPSNGRVQPPWEYHSDRDDAAGSGTAMARFMMRLVDFLGDGGRRCKQKIHLVSHSMGNWALRHAVQGVVALSDQAQLPTMFANAFLMAADEDEDAFERPHKLGPLPELARAIHIYHSRSDLALITSDVTKMNPDRLGSGGPRSFSGLSNRIVAIDCSAVDSTTPAHGNHQYYRLRPEVIADVRAVLSGRFLPDQVPHRFPIEGGRRYRIERP